jgi:microcystin-dependent protein
MFGGFFEPAGWKFCSGQQLQIAENDVLFQLIGTTYGGDGVNTFNLPDLRGRLPLHMGGGFTLGQADGVETVTLTQPQMPTHSHAFFATTNVTQQTQATDQVLGNSATALMYIEDTGSTPLNSNAITPTGLSEPHDNRQPFLCVEFIISLYGIFPSQT